MKTKGNTLMIRNSEKWQITSIMICALMVLNLYGSYLQRKFGINSFIFVLLPLTVILLRMMVTKQNLKLSKSIAVPVGILLVTCALQMARQVFSVSSIKYLVYIIIFLVVANVSSRQDWELTKKTICLISIVMTIDALIQVPTLLKINYRLYNVRQLTMLDKPWYSLLLTFASLVLIIDLLIGQKKRRILKICMIVFFTAVNLLVIQSKSSILCVLFGIVVFLINANKKTRNKVLIIGIPLVFVAMLYLVFNQQEIPDYIKVMLNRYFGLFSDASINNYSFYEGSFTSRSKIIAYNLQLIMDHPLLGIGFGRYSEYGTALNVIETESSIMNSFVEGGLVYGVAHLSLVYIILKRLIKYIKNNGRDCSSIQLITIFILYLIFNMMNDYMTAMYWAFLGIAFAYTRNPESVRGV